MKKATRMIGITLLACMLMQTVMGAVFADGSDVTWSLAPTTEKKIKLYGDYERYTSGMGFCFQPADSDKCGVIDKAGNVIIPAEYEKLMYFYGDAYAQVKKDGKTGIINAKNEAVIAFGTYDFIEKADENACIANKDGKYALVSIEGKSLTDFIYESMSLKNNLCISAKKDGKYGILGTDGKVILPCEYDSELEPWCGGKIFLTHKNVKTYDDACFIDAKGKVLYDGFCIPNMSRAKEAISLSFWNGANNPDVYIDVEGNRLAEDPRYLNGYRVDYATNTCYVVYNEGEKTGLADKNMNILLPCEYTSIMPVRSKNKDCEIFCTSTGADEKISYVDSAGKTIDFLEPYKVDGITASGLIVCSDKESGNYGMLDQNGNILIPFEYKYLTETKDNLFALETYTGKWGIAEFGTGTKVKDTFEGIVLKINSNEAKAFNQSVTIDAAPIIRNGRTMLPARFIAENLGKSVSRDAATQTVTIGNDSLPLSITIGSSQAKVGAYPLQLDAPAFIENERTYTPVRFIAENLGATVFWDQATQTVKILRKN